ncbi:MAG: 4-sulfomuconolactone hydrolase [Pseudomonas citronellolis]|nr:MAG: 4-sulfomuconolactone hydrolase [Pseudomonas citronellolis]
MTDYLPFDPNPRSPDPLPPLLACDSQFHVFGPQAKYPTQPNAAYSMPSATWETARELHRILGIQRGVIVQATTYGADHSVVLDALEGLNAGHASRRYLGCANAAVLVERDEAYLHRLHDAGVRGARFSRAGLGITLTPAQLDRALAIVTEMGWYVKVQPAPGGIVDQLADFQDLDIPVVFDHMGRPKPELGLQDPSLERLVSLLRNENFWVMLSLAEKISTRGKPWDDVLPVAQTLIDVAPERCIWGSDWPHPISTKQPPNEGDLLELLYRFAPDPATRQRILVSNPANLFGFDL